MKRYYLINKFLTNSCQCGWLLPKKISSRCVHLIEQNFHHFSTCSLNCLVNKWATGGGVVHRVVWFVYLLFYSLWWAFRCGNSIDTEHWQIFDEWNGHLGRLTEMLGIRNTHGPKAVEISHHNWFGLTIIIIIKAKQIKAPRNCPVKTNYLSMFLFCCHLNYLDLWLVINISSFTFDDKHVNLEQFNITFTCERYNKRLRVTRRTVRQINR